MDSEPQDGASCCSKETPGDGRDGTPAETRAAATGSSESSGVALDRPTMALRLGLISLVALAALALGLYEAPRLRTFSPVRRLFEGPPDFLASLPSDFPVLDGDVALAGDPVIINGREVTSVRLASERDPKSLVLEYARRLEPLGYICTPGVGRDGSSGQGLVRFAGPGQAMLGFRDPEGHPMGIVAFENSQTGGCDYFITRERDTDRDGTDFGEAAGEDPPEVYVPPDATREYCVERKGRHPATLVLYKTWERPTMVAHLYGENMVSRGWKEPDGSSEAFEGTREGIQMLFHRGGERCLVHLAEGDGEEATWITLAYRRGQR